MKRIATAAFFLAILTWALPIQAQQQIPDFVDFRLIDPGTCCYDMYLENSHRPASPIDLIRLELLTQEAHFVPGSAGGPWPVHEISDRHIFFQEQGLQLPPDEFIEGFHFCIEIDPGHPRLVQIIWSTEFNGRVTSKDTVWLDCSVTPQVCDSVVIAAITIPTQPEGSCCYDITVKNTHEPQGSLDGLRLRLQTPGATITGTPTGPWNVLDQTATSVTFGGASPLASGGSLGGFRLCVDVPQGTPTDLVFQWFTSSGGQDICDDFETVSCTPKLNPRPDTLLLEHQQDCNYEIGFINNHVPRSSLNRFRLSVVTPGASFASITEAAGWTIASQTGLNVTFNKSGAPLAPLDSVKGFQVGFNPSSTGLVRFVWSTFNGTTLVSRDTVQVQCDPPPPTFCDSLLVSPVAESCSFDFGFVNTHEPASAINDFRIRVHTPGSIIRDVTPPEGWIVGTWTDTEVLFRDTLGVVAVGEEQTGFLLSFTPGDFGDQVFIEWCTSLDGSTHCCEFTNVECIPEEERCDSLAATLSGDLCGYEFSLSNLKVPNEGLDAWSLRLDDPATMLLAATAPDGWDLDTLDEQMLRFVKRDGVLGTGETAEGFVIRFVPSLQSSQIPFTWCTERDEQERCCDTMSVACEIGIVQCDVIDVITSTEEPCCFDFNIENAHLPRGTINAFNVRIVTPGVSLFSSTISNPDGWTHISGSTQIGWRNANDGIAPGAILGGFKVCYDNSAIGNADFEIVTQTVQDGRIICEDTLTIKCDRTLRIDVLPGQLPDHYGLLQNYPNPFNPATTIQFELPARTDIMLSLYDAHGRLVMDLGSGEYEAGSWQITLNASDLPSGTYFYQLRSQAFTATRAMILLK